VAKVLKLSSNVSDVFPKLSSEVSEFEPLLLGLRPGGGLTATVHELELYGIGERGEDDDGVVFTPGGDPDAAASTPQIQMINFGNPGRGLHSLTSMLNLGTFGDTSLTLELNLSNFAHFGTHSRVNLVIWGIKSASAERKGAR
jgi:hypothetical protein